MHKIAPIILRKQKKKLTRAHLKKAISINRLMNHKNAARTSKDVQIKHERTKAAVLAGMLKKQQSSHERLANRLRKRSSSANMKVHVPAEKTLTSPLVNVHVAEKAVVKVKVRVEERVTGLFYLGDVVVFQRSKKPQRAEIVEVVAVDPVVGVTNAASVQGYVICFLSMKKASKKKFTLAEYIRLEVSEVAEIAEVAKANKANNEFDLRNLPKKENANNSSQMAATEVKKQVTAAATADVSKISKPRPKFVLADSDSD